MFLPNVKETSGFKAKLQSQLDFKGQTSQKGTFFVGLAGLAENAMYCIETTAIESF